MKPTTKSHPKPKRGRPRSPKQKVSITRRVELETKAALIRLAASGINIDKLVKAYTK